MIRIEGVQTYTIPLSQGFAYITDLELWGSYWPNFVRIKDAESAQWRKPGDTITLVIRLLNRERELSMALEEYKPDAFVGYVSRQAGLPDARHERYFRAVPQGFEYRLVVTYTPRPGLAGLFDRSLVRTAVAHAARKTLHNLDLIFKRQPGALSLKGAGSNGQD